MPAKLHLTEDSLPLHLLLERLERLIDVVVANQNLHVPSPSIGPVRLAHHGHDPQARARIRASIIEVLERGG
jgi:hypothetical protein